MNPAELVGRVVDVTWYVGKTDSTVRARGRLAAATADRLYLRTQTRAMHVDVARIVGKVEPVD